VLQLTPTSLAVIPVEIEALTSQLIYYHHYHPIRNPFTTAAPPYLVLVKFGSVEWFVLVVVFFDHFPYKKSPVHNTNLHQNIFTRK
jgi:hypothetical protein